MGGPQRPGATSSAVKQAVEEYVECGGRVIEVIEPFHVEVRDGLQNQIFYCNLDPSHFTLIQPLSYHELTTGLPSPTSAALPEAYVAASTGLQPLAPGEDWAARTWRPRVPLPTGEVAAHMTHTSAGQSNAAAAANDALRRRAAAASAAAASSNAPDSAAAGAAAAALSAGIGAGRKQYKAATVGPDGVPRLESAADVAQRQASERAAVGLAQGTTVAERAADKVSLLRTALSSLDGIDVDVVVVRDLEPLLGHGLTAPAAEALLELCIALEDLAAQGAIRGYALSVPNLALPPGAHARVELDDLCAIAIAAASRAREARGLGPVQSPPTLLPYSASAEPVGTVEPAGLEGTRLIAVSTNFSVLTPEAVIPRPTVVAPVPDAPSDHSSCEERGDSEGESSPESAGSEPADSAAPEVAMVSLRAAAAARNLLFFAERSLEPTIGPGEGGELDLAEPAPASAETLSRAQFESTDALDFMFAIERVYPFLVADALSAPAPPGRPHPSEGPGPLPPPIAIGVGSVAHAYADRLANVRRFDEVIGRRLAPALDEALARLQGMPQLQAFAKNYRGGFRAWREGRRRLLEHYTAPALFAADSALLASFPTLATLPSLPSRALAASVGAGVDSVALPPTWSGALQPLVQTVRSVHERGLDEYEDDGSPLLPHCVPTAEDVSDALQARAPALRAELRRHLLTVTQQLAAHAEHEADPLFLGPCPPGETPTATIPRRSDSSSAGSALRPRPIEYWQALPASSPDRAALEADPSQAHLYPPIRSRAFDALDGALKGDRMRRFRASVGGSVPRPQPAVLSADEFAEGAVAVRAGGVISKEGQRWGKEA